MSDCLHRAGVALASAVRSASVESPDIINDRWLGIEVIVVVASVGLTSEKQTITVDAAGGTFKVTFSAQQTAPLAFNISAADLQTALEGLSTIGAGNIEVTGGVGAAGGGTPYTLWFRGDLAGANQPAVTTDATSLTGGAGTAAVATTQAGGATSTPSVVFTIDGKAETSGTWYNLLTSAAKTGAGTTRLLIYPAVAASANVSVDTIASRVLRIVATHADYDEITYSVEYVLLR